MSDWIVKGLARLLAIMAVLQLIKKLPDLINTIFGTHIQTRGGIKGRLGEMAGIGGLAQKAWTSLGTGAKNLAKLATVGGAGLVAYGGYKLATGDSKGKKGFEGLVNRLRNGDDIRDNKVVKRARGVLSGARAAVKTGSITQVADAYTKAQAPASVSATQRLRLNKDEMEAIHDASEVTLANGRKVNMFDKNGVLQNMYDDGTGKLQYFDADQINQVRQNISSRLNKYGKAGEKKAAIISNNLDKALYEGMLKKNETAVAGFKSYADSYANNASDDDRKMAQSIANAIDNGSALNKDQIDFINNNRNNDYLSQTITAYEKMIKQQGAMGLSIGDTGSVQMKTKISTLEGTVASLKRDYEIEASDMSQADKDRMDIIEASLNASNASMAPTLQNNTWISRQQTYTGAQNANTNASRGQYLDNVRVGLIQPTASDYGVLPSVFDVAKAAADAGGHEVGTVAYTQDIITAATAAGYSQAEVSAISDRCNEIVRNVSYNTRPVEVLKTYSTRAAAQQYYNYATGLANNEITAANNAYTAADNAYTAAEAAFNSATADWQNAQTAANNATTDWQTAISDYNHASTEYSTAKAAVDAAAQDLQLATASGRSSEINAARQIYDAAKIEADRKKQEMDSFEQARQVAEESLNTATEYEIKKRKARQDAETAKNEAATARQDAINRQTDANTKLNEINTEFNSKP